MLWNANGLQKRKNELEITLENEEVDVCLLTETHLSANASLKFSNYTAYFTPHPSNSSRGGSAILVKKSIKHYEDDGISSEYFQTTTVTVETFSNPIQLTSLYSPPRSIIKQEAYVELLNNFEHRYIIGGDFNAKHTAWGSRLTTTKGRELHKAVLKTGCSVAATGKPTYWPTDKYKIPDLIDFFILNKISPNNVIVEDNVDLDSDHTPVFLKLYEKPVHVEKSPSLVNKFTDWKYFHTLLEAAETSICPITTVDELDDEVLCFTQRIQAAAWRSNIHPMSATPSLKLNIQIISRYS